MEVIQSQAFAGCKNLYSIIIPDSVKYIGSSAWAGCTNLAKIKIGRNVSEIGYNAFRDCPNLTTIYIPKGKKIIFNEMTRFQHNGLFVEYE